MKFRAGLVLALLTFSALPLRAATDRDRLVGTWIFQREVDTRADGSPAPAGASASDYEGQLTYTADGSVTAVIMPKGRKWETDTATIAELRDTASNGTAYAGRYELDEAKHTVTHHVRVCLEPSYEGKSLVRTYALKGNELKVSGTFEYQRETIRFEVTWARSPGETGRSVAASHVEANVPAPEDFDRFLRRDLASYFARTAKKDVTVDFELLREGATQSGVSYPKFYAWVRVAGGRSPGDRGAVRLAAIEGKRFEVTDFVSEEAIQKAPESIREIFPEPVCEAIWARLKGISSLK